MTAPLVLSLFPGIGLLDMAFEEEGFCVVRGPDVLWGGDVRRFHPPAGRFDGVIGGPPCQAHSTMSRLSLIGNGVAGGHRHGDMIPEFCRVVSSARPAWFVMENVVGAPEPNPFGYGVSNRRLNNRWFGEDQNRLRRFSFGVRDGDVRQAELVWAGLEVAPLMSGKFEHAVLAGHGPAAGQRVRGIKGRHWPEMARLQGLPEEWIARMQEERVLTTHGFKRVIGNGVPLPMGRAIARAVKHALATRTQLSDGDVNAVGPIGR